MRRHLALVALLLGLLAVAAPSTFAAGPKQKDNDTHVQLLAINDFHGNLEPPAGSSGRIAVAPGGATVDAGGAEYLVDAHQDAARSSNPNTLVVGAGDLIGASPLLSGLFHDEPTIEAMNEIGDGRDRRRQPRVRRRGRRSCCACRTAAATRSTAARTARRSSARSSSTWPRTCLCRHAEHGPAGLRDQEVRQRQDRVHRPDARGHAADRHAGRRRRASSSHPRSLTVNRLVTTLREDEGVRAIVVLIHEGGQQNAPFAGRLHGHQPLRQLHRCDQADRRGARPAGRPRRLGAHASAVHLQVQRHPDHERIVVRAPDHGHRPDDRPPVARTSRRSTRTT